MAQLHAHPSMYSAPAFLTEHTTGLIVRNTFRIFFGNFVPLFLIYGLPTLPFYALQMHGAHVGSPALVVAGTLGFLMAGLVAWTGITVAVADICVGEKPGVWRAYRRGFCRIPLKVVGTAILAGALVSAVVALTGLVGFLSAVVFESGMARGLALVTVGGVGLIASLVVFASYLFVGQVVVLEPVWGRAALRRSRALGAGHYLRNLLIVIFCSIVAYIPHLLFVAVVSKAAQTAFGAENALADLFFAAGALAFGPLYTVSTVLLYYEMRVRKEAYNVHGLMADVA